VGILRDISTFDEYLGFYCFIEPWSQGNSELCLLFFAKLYDGTAMRVRYAHSIHRELLSEENRWKILSCQGLLSEEYWLRCTGEGFMFPFV
jgi:hypothetical protein